MGFEVVLLDHLEAVVVVVDEAAAGADDDGGDGWFAGEDGLLG